MNEWGIYKYIQGLKEKNPEPELFFPNCRFGFVFMSATTSDWLVMLVWLRLKAVSLSYYW